MLYHYYMERNNCSNMDNDIRILRISELQQNEDTSGFTKFLVSVYMQQCWDTGLGY